MLGECSVRAQVAVPSVLGTVRATVRPVPAPDAPASAGDEFAVLARLRQRLADPRAFRGLRSPQPGEVFAGDDAAVLAPPTGHLLFATDLVVEGVHFDLRFGSLEDAGWKAVSVNVSDIAAMGGEPLHVVAGVSAAPGTDLDALGTGLAQACGAYSLGLVGGDLTSGASLMIAVAVTGRCDKGRAVLRSGASPGDAIFLTGALGSSSAGLVLLGSGVEPTTGDPSVQAYRRPVARVSEGRLAARLGATAMIDISDGLTADLDHIATESVVGLRLDTVPVAAGATLDDALGGGEDYELAFTVPAQHVDIVGAFTAEGLRPPIRIGTCVADASERSLGGRKLRIVGWSHRFS